MMLSIVKYSKVSTLKEKLAAKIIQNDWWLPELKTKITESGKSLAESMQLSWEGEPLEEDGKSLEQHYLSNDCYNCSVTLSLI